MKFQQFFPVGASLAVAIISLGEISCSRDSMTIDRRGETSRSSDDSSSPAQLEMKGARRKGSNTATTTSTTTTPTTTTTTTNTTTTNTTATTTPTTVTTTTTPTSTAVSGTAKRLMVIGDSISENAPRVTSDQNCPQGYRYEFWKRLVDSGMAFDMIGVHSMSREWGWTYQSYGGKIFDDDVNAWGGWTSGEILAGVPAGTLDKNGSVRWGAGAGGLDSWLAATEVPDLVLLHIGTNDAWRLISASTWEANVKSIIAKLQARNPAVIVLLAKLIPFGSYTGDGVPAARPKIPEYNALIDGIAASASTAQSKVVVVDQYAGYDGDVDNACDIYTAHPGISGARKMADKWMAAVNATVGSPTNGTAAGTSTSAATTPTTTAIRKKGVGTWYYGPTVSNSIQDQNASWYYTWGPSTADAGISQPTGVQFVPMIWDETMVTSANLEKVKGSGSGTLLGFNEPEIAEQANMTVTQALDLWPQLSATGLRLGSPAFAHDPAQPGSWGEQFMNGAAQKGYKVDFIAVHWYGTQTDSASAVAALQSFLTRIHDKYQKPIWLTEFSLINWYPSLTFPTTLVQSTFASDSAKMLETLSFVERYAWFSMSKYTQSAAENSYLYSDAGVVTEVGKAYKAVGN